jgi:alanyl-tRNA synthetase
MDIGIVAEILDGRTIGEIRQLGHMLVENQGLVALLIGKDSGKLGITFARSADRNEDMNALLKRVCEKTGCRGGGNPSFATGGGGPDVNADEILEAAKKAFQ